MQLLESVFHLTLMVSCCYKALCPSQVFYVISVQCDCAANNPQVHVVSSFAIILFLFLSLNKRINTQGFLFLFFLFIIIPLDNSSHNCYSLKVA